MTIVAIAKVCHMANKMYCETHGDLTQVAWSDAPQWQQDSAIDGVVFCLSNPGLPASANHENWSKAKLRDGWKYGEKKDPEKKEHPCLVPFDQLPLVQQKKDKLFKAIVEALA